MNSGEDQSLKNLQAIADGILKKLLLASGNQTATEKMGGKIHFKLTHDGVTRRFALLREDENLISSLKAKVFEIVGAEDVKLYWKDDESSIVLESVDDINAAIDYAETKNKLGCITLEIGEEVTKKDQTKKDERKVVTCQESSAAFNGFVFTCASCKCYLAPSNGGRFMCMVCDNFGLCAACHAKGSHDNHAFAHLMNGKTEIPFLLPSKGLMFMFANQAPRCTPKFNSSNDYDKDEAIDNQATRVENISYHEKNDRIFGKIAMRMREHERSIDNFDVKDMEEDVKRLAEEIEHREKEDKERRLWPSRSEFMQMDNQADKDDIDWSLLERIEKELKAKEMSTGQSVGKEVDRNVTRGDGFMMKNKKRWEEGSDDESTQKPLIDIDDSSMKTKKNAVSRQFDLSERPDSVASTDGRAPSMGETRRGGRPSSVPSITTDYSNEEEERREKKIENDDSDFGDDKSLDGYEERVERRYETGNSTDDEPLTVNSYRDRPEKRREEEVLRISWISKPNNDNLSYREETRRRREEKEEKIRGTNDSENENDWKRNDGGFGSGERKNEVKNGFAQDNDYEGYGGRGGRSGGGFGRRDNGFGRDDRGFGGEERGDRGNGGVGSRRGGRGGFGGGHGFGRTFEARKSAFAKDDYGFERDRTDDEERRPTGGFAERGFGGRDSERNGGFGRSSSGFGGNGLKNEERGFRFTGEESRYLTDKDREEGKSFNERWRYDERFGRYSGNERNESAGKWFGGIKRDDDRGFGYRNGGFGDKRDYGGFGKRVGESRYNRGIGGRGGMNDDEFGRRERYDERERRFGADSNRHRSPNFNSDRRGMNEDLEMDAYMKASQMPAHLTIKIIDKFKNDSFGKMESMIERYKYILETNSHGITCNPPVFNVGIEKYLLANICVDLHKHLSALECPLRGTEKEKEEFRRRLFDTQAKLVSALGQNGTYVQSYKDMAEELGRILLTQQYTLNTRSSHGLNKAFVGFMGPDPQRENAKPPRVPCSEFYFVFCEEHSNKSDFNANPSPRYRCPSVFPM